jgi:peptide-methionine (S)-S-oxide reductase
VNGVISTAVGYSGGDFANPTYGDVCSGKTGHTEVVQVEYDPSVVSYERLLDIFWIIHDPTAREKTQYESVIFYSLPEQGKVARASKMHLESTGQVTCPIVTAIEPAKTFWRAEEYHQHYYGKQGNFLECPSSDADT